MIRANAAEPSTLKPNPLQRWWAGLIRSLAPASPLGVAPASGMLPAGQYSADICIVTNAAFSGGNAASTVTEFLAFQRAGLQVLMVHCPIRSSRAKSHWLAERYLPHQRSIISADLAQAIRCKTLIVRGPRMIMAKPFARLAPRIETQRALFVINNSASNEDGTHLFDWSELNSRVVQIDWPQSSIFPISPIIRAEAVRALSKQASHRLAPGDWPPAFDVEAYSYAPRGRLTPPIVIGRHGRDHPGKWLEDAHDLRSAYPDAPELRVRVMGGAATVERRLGKLPSNWEVEPFSTAGVAKFLAGLDVLV